MTIPTVVNVGSSVTITGAAGTYSTLSPSAPALNVLANDLLIILHSARAGTSVDTLEVPADFTSLTVAGLGTPLAHQVSYRLADGNEDGIAYDLDGTYTGTSPVHCGRVYQFRSTALSSFTEGLNQASGISTTVSSSSLTTLGIDRLALCAITYANGNSVGTLNGTPVWSDQFGESRHSTISNQLQTCPLGGTPPNTGVTRAAATMSISTSSRWTTATFALIGIQTASNIPNKYRSQRQTIKRASFY